MNIYEKLTCIQFELKAPKTQYNGFGKYYYRNSEDIFEAVKPVLFNHKVSLFLTDEVVLIAERFYIRATATLINVEKPEEKLSVVAFAREEDNKKGMDGSQVTGASSSYARKYALNGLFAIDDTKDSDATNNGGVQPHKGVEDKKKDFKKETKPSLHDIRGAELRTMAEEFKANLKTIAEKIKLYGVNAVEELTEQQYAELLMKIKKGELDK